MDATTNIKRTEDNVLVDATDANGQRYTIVKDCNVRKERKLFLFYFIRLI
jgi:hypothetical protein